MSAVLENLDAAQRNFDCQVPEFVSLEEKRSQLQRQNLEHIFATIQSDDKEAKEVAGHLFSNLSYDGYIKLIRATLAGKREEVFQTLLQQVTEAVEIRADITTEAEL